MMRTVITSEKFISNVMSRLMKDYDRIFVTRDESNKSLWRVIAARFGADFKIGDTGRLDVVVPASAVDPPPNSSWMEQ